VGCQLPLCICDAFYFSLSKGSFKLDSTKSCLYVIFIPLVSFVLFLHRSFGCVCRSMIRPLKHLCVPGTGAMTSSTRNDAWGQDGYRSCKVSLNAFFDNFVLACLLPCNAIVGAKKVASIVASQLFCSANVVGQC
jgi:hypothetical protein